VGDITFNFDLLTESFTYQDLTSVLGVNTDTGFLKTYTSLNSFTYKNGWQKAKNSSQQKVIRQYDVQGPVSQLEIDVYKNAGDLNDLTCSVFVNNKHFYDYSISRQDGKAIVVFENELSAGDSVIFKTSSSTEKNENGYYEFPINLEHNPNNVNLNTFVFNDRRLRRF
jgi:hypothetical protein